MANADWTPSCPVCLLPVHLQDPPQRSIRSENRFSNLLAVALVLGGYFLLGDWVDLVPLPSLATLVIFIGASLVKARQIKTVSQATRSDGIVFVVTLGVGLLISLQMAIFVGVLTSILLFLRKVSEPEMVEHGYTETGELAEFSEKTKRAEPEVSIVHVEGELFFAAADLFYEQIRRVGEDQNLRVFGSQASSCPPLGCDFGLGLGRAFGLLEGKKLPCPPLRSPQGCTQNLEKFRGALRINRKKRLSSLCRQPPLCPRPRPSNEPSTSYRESRQR